MHVYRLTASYYVLKTGMGFNQPFLKLAIFLYFLNVVPSSASNEPAQPKSQSQSKNCITLLESLSKERRPPWEFSFMSTILLDHKAMLVNGYPRTICMPKSRQNSFKLKYQLLHIRNNEHRSRKAVRKREIAGPSQNNFIQTSNVTPIANDPQQNTVSSSSRSITSTIAVTVMPTISTTTPLTIRETKPTTLRGNKTAKSLAVVSPSDISLRPQKVRVNIMLFVSSNQTYMFTRARVEPAVRLALKFFGHKIDPRIIFGETDCTSATALNNMFEYRLKGLLTHVMLGPVCDYCISPIAKQLYFWNIPTITTGGAAAEFSLKEQFRLLTRVGVAGMEKLAASFAVLLRNYSWTRFLTLYDADGQNDVLYSLCHFTAAAMVYNTGKYTNITKTDYFQLERSKFGQAEYAANMLRDEVGTKYSVIIMCASADAVREIMLEAQRLGFTNGEYIFFNIDLFASKTRLSRPWYKQNDSTENNESAKQAFQSLMMITLKKPDDEKYREFSDQVKTQAAKDFPGFDYGEDEVNSFVGAFHDAVLLYAIALNETLASGGNITNGTAITQKMWGRKFNGITGEVTIDNKGDREADYSLLNFNPETDTFDVAANYLGSTKEFSIRRQIYWVGGSPPLDTPKCGFDKSGCPEREVFPAWGGVTVGFSAVLIILSVIGFFVYRRYKLESELNSMTWRIRSEDIIFGSRHGKGGGAGMLTRRDSRMSFMSRLSTDSMGVLDHGILNKNQVFTKTAYYKGSIMALKPLSVRTITVNRAFLMEIKSMKDIQNDHIVRFVGVCLDSHHEYIITEYCQKGSLQDILENDQIQLDAMFKTSLLQDIIRGMEYLHSSVIRYHGNLKSTNCVVDSRFVLKITDFGLNTLRSYAYRMESEDDCEYQQCKRKLWTAPELLDSEQLPTVTSYQKGDVYSFAIICQEVIYRQGVFSLEETEHIDPEEIIKTLRSERTFRPKLYSTDCDVPEEAAFIKRCWTVEPADRPDFPSIKAQYRRFAKHAQLKGGNLVDNLLSRMELYANNLESLVEERTADYLEEKKKAEDLLYMMLPKSIASILIKGESVTAEWFDQVTIYFSDICGFTALSAESTPMQVVALLNDLYTVFDTIIENFDVYKVETIGDAYMVVSGLPNKNGQDHAKEIARMSLKLLEAVKTFKIRHIPNKQLKLRIGIHTGPVCAGVVGLKMPRYCLFGDTVNTASRMESNGLPLRIHVSPDTEKILRTFGTFELELRGQVEMKGKGTVTTYWLNGDKSQDIIINPPIQQNNRLKPIFRRRPSIVPSIPEEDTEDKRRSAPLLNNLCQLPSNNLKTSTLTNNNSLPLLKNNENGLIKRGKSPTPHGKAEFRANGDRANGKDLELAEYERIPLVNRNLEVV